MDRTERFYKIDQLLNARKIVPLTIFLDELGISRATFRRDLEYMRDRLHAPIEWDPELRGYRFANPDSNGPAYTLPGLWLNASELHALLTMYELLGNLEPGVLNPHVEPLLDRVSELLEDKGHAEEEIRRRIRVLGMASRPLTTAEFETVVSALLGRKQLKISHYNKERDTVIDRTVSPQRVVHYRDNWYLDAWCHERRALRTFSLDGIKRAEPRVEAARDVPEEVLDQELGSGYGIFAGTDTQTAILRFSALRARWVADEQWHPKQRCHRDKEGCYILEVPYADDRELLMDVLKHGHEVEVLAPESLREKVALQHQAAADLYENGSPAEKKTSRSSSDRPSVPYYRLTS